MESALIIFMWHKLIKYLSSSLNYKRYVSTLPYIYFPSRMKYSSRNSFVMVPRSTMTSDHLMKISVGIFGCRNSASTSHIWETHPSSFWYKVSPIRIIVDVSVVTDEMTLCSQLLVLAYIYEVHFSIPNRLSHQALPYSWITTSQVLDLYLLLLFFFS